MIRLPRRSLTASPAPSVVVVPAPRPDVSIVMVAYGTGPLLIDTLRSIVDAAVGCDLSTEVIVVSNPHPTRGDHSAVLLRLFTSGVALVEPSTNVGFGGGCELGAMFASGDLIAFVNPDVTVARGWLEPLVDVVRSAVVPTIASPVLLDADGTVQEAGQRLLPSGSTQAITERPEPDQVIDVDYASAACWVMSRLGHERVGGFDPAYHPAYFEDVDLAERWRRAGGRCVVVGGSSIVHLHGRGTPDAPAPANRQRDILLRRWPDLWWRQADRGAELPSSAATTRHA